MGDGTPEKGSKGKGKQAAEPEESSRHDPDDALLSRIAKSASSLPSVLFSGAPQASELAAVGASEKAGSSRAAESLSRVGENVTQVRTDIPDGQTLKSGPVQEHVAREEAAFSAFLDSTGPWLPSESGGALEGAWQSSTHSTTSPLGATGETTGVSLSAAEQQARDGQDVVALLSSSFGDTGLDSFEDEALSPGDLSNLRKALFGDGQDEGKDNNSQAIMWDNTLNFTPAYLRETGQGNDVDLAQHMGTADRAETWETWIGQWSRVLTEYQDEVWGDLGALVEQARAEVKQLEEKGGTISGIEAPEAVAPALLRLRAILGHLRGGS